jgi:hypothetical protein
MGTDTMIMIAGYTPMDTAIMIIVSVPISPSLFISENWMMVKKSGKLIQSPSSIESIEGYLTLNQQMENWMMGKPSI